MENENVVLMKRSAPPKSISRSVILFAVVIVLFGFLLGLSIANVNELEDFAPMAIGFCSLLCIISIIGLIDSGTKITQNKKANKDMIIYNPNTKKIIMNTMKGEVVEMEPNNFVDMSKNMFKDFIINVKYWDGTKYRVIKLGWTLEHSQSIRYIRKLQNGEIY